MASGIDEDESKPNETVEISTLPTISTTTTTEIIDQEMRTDTSSEKPVSETVATTANEPSKSDDKEEEYEPDDLNDTSKKKKLIEHTSQQLRKRLCLLKINELNDCRLKSIDNLNEQFFLENSLIYTNYDRWRTDLINMNLNTNQSNLNYKRLFVDYVNKNFKNYKEQFSQAETNICERFKLEKPLVKYNTNTDYLITSKSVLNPDSSKTASIAERAKHEAQILQRISALRKEGLLTIKRLPKLVEPPRLKTHWDFY